VCDQSGVTLRIRSRSQHYGGHLRSNNSLQSLINIAKLAENSTEALEFLRSKADIANVVRLTVGYCESESVSQQICTITACTVVQAVVKANSQSNAKGQILTPRGSKTPEQISMKLRLYNYIRRGCATHANPYGAATTCGGLGELVTSHAFWFLRPFLLFTARRFASAVYAMGLCPSVCHKSEVLLKRLDVGPH